MLAAAAEAGLTNLSAELGDAVEFLTERVPPGSLDAVHLFFPDPWPKARHHRRRCWNRHWMPWTSNYLNRRHTQREPWLPRPLPRPDWSPGARVSPSFLVAP